MFFEGSEKKAEIVLTPDVPSLRLLSRDYWETLLGYCGASILSQCSNDHLDAYILSESSLFVWHDRLLLITCGDMSLIDTVTFFLQDYAPAQIAMLCFQRKNEFCSQLQKSTFEDDAEALSRLLPGSAVQLGQADGHHNAIWTLNRPGQAWSGQAAMSKSDENSDTSAELLMYDIHGDSADYLRSSYQTRTGIRRLLKLEALLPGFVFDDHLFSPLGYSLNGICGHDYITVHITPQESASFVSVETSLDLARACPDLIAQLIAVFQPGSFDVITFNCSPALQFSEPAQLQISQRAMLSSGDRVCFQHYQHAESVTTALVTGAVAEPAPADSA